MPKGKKPVNAVSGKQGFQKTGRKDPVGYRSGFMSRLMGRLSGSGTGTPEFTGSSFPPPPRLGVGPSTRSMPGPSHAELYGHWSGSTPTAPSEAKALTTAESDELWKTAFYKSKEYGPHRRFDVHHGTHDRIADMAELIRSEASTPRLVGRPGIDDFAYIRQGDLGLQVRATRQLARDVLDLDSPSHSRVEGLSVYGQDTIALAREIEDSGHNESFFTMRGRFVQSDGSEKQTDVLDHKAWKLVELVERDQQNSKTLQESRESRPAEWKSPTRQYPSRFSL